MKFENRTFDGENVLLDGSEFINCKFTNCTVTYMGVTGIMLKAPTFENCHWLFHGPAANTVNFMGRLYAIGGGARRLIEHTMSNIKAGVYEPAEKE